MKKQIREVLVSDIIRYFIIPLLIITGLWTLFFAVLIHHGVLMLVISLTATVAATYILLKYLLIGAVLLYKAFAPMKMRDQCRFEPTCSTYMILALQKYGLIRGLVKGIRRIIRCRPPNSGIDYP